ncbi:YegS/Rv2252/BmrU family lipid kinase [Antarcticibacterium arcticum]|uniref:YegS/Rv2252/BmrU family lipid kinase n=1 Tax=Antarcticibacterium arcticum TaxID=2585771 RepID=A0A5B8YI38_9FLAO|nr:YegS/Rv2252/BmrU family lipid kinase [Antarcticibacterium arcticum]QED37281.1 YegS/Rv2252/BmrU family lipid kinase [Antarcticibacterium arcticum]
MGKINTVLLVVNPISGAIDKAELIEEIKLKAVQNAVSLILFSTTGENDKLKLEKLIAEKDPCRIVVAGGDGTIKLVAEALGNKKTPIGIIPAGSSNGLSYNLHLPATLEEQITTAFNGEVIDMDIISINGDYCLHMSDFGVNAELISRYEKSRIRGKLGYLLQTLPTLVTSDYPFKFTIEANGRTFETEGILLAIANASSYGTGAKVNPKGKINDGVFEILIYKEFDFIEILKTLRNEVDPDPEVVEVITATEAKITCDPAVAFQIDGEYLGRKNSIEVTILPKKTRIVAPIRHL